MVVIIMNMPTANAVSPDETMAERAGSWWISSFGQGPSHVANAFTGLLIITRCMRLVIISLNFKSS